MKTGYKSSAVKLKEKNMNPRNSQERFRFSSGNNYPCKRKIDVPVKLIDEEGREKRLALTTCVVDADIPFLFGNDYQKKLGIVLDGKDGRCLFKEIDKEAIYPLQATKGGHYLLEFQKWGLLRKRRK